MTAWLTLSRHDVKAFNHLVVNDRTAVADEACFNVTLNPQGMEIATDDFRTAKKSAWACRKRFGMLSLAHKGLPLHALLTF
jgi:hypothetical protein